MKNIGLVSDLHLEASNYQLEINPQWDYLIIAGDLSAERDLIESFFYTLSHKNTKNIPILYVLGNHEHELHDIDETPYQIKEMLKEYRNVHVLNNESIVLDGIKFIGTTLWTNFEYGGVEGINSKEENMRFNELHVGDFNRVFYKNEITQKTERITAEYMVKLHNKAYKFLEFELKKNPFDGEKVVITHFAPHPKCINPQYEKHNSSYWVSDLESLMGFSTYWFHGHLHHSIDMELHGTKVACNPRGFTRIYNLTQNLKFNKDVSFEVENKENTPPKKCKIK